MKKDDRSASFRAEKAPLFRRFTQFKAPDQTVGFVDLGASLRKHMDVPFVERFLFTPRVILNPVLTFWHEKVIGILLDTAVSTYEYTPTLKCLPLNFLKAAMPEKILIISSCHYRGARLSMTLRVNENRSTSGLSIYFRGTGHSNACSDVILTQFYKTEYQWPSATASERTHKALHKKKRLQSMWFHSIM